MIRAILMTLGFIAAGIACIVGLTAAAVLRDWMFLIVVVVGAVAICGGAWFNRSVPEPPKAGTPPNARAVGRAAVPANCRAVGTHPRAGAR